MDIMNKAHVSILSKELQISEKQIAGTIQLLEEGATIPFISRYRKEITGSLDEVQIANISTRMSQLVELEKRRETVLHTIEEQGKLTAELRKKITNTYDPIELEDLYLPYKPKRKTKASVAREKGLEPLALHIMEQSKNNLFDLAKSFLSKEKDVSSIEDALQGARDIVAEMISETKEVRSIIRSQFQRQAVVKSYVAKGKEEEGSKYKDYFEYEEPLQKCPSHRFLAIMRGVNEEILKLSIAPDHDTTIQAMEISVIKKNATRESREQLDLAIKDSYKRLLQPSIETEFRQMTKEKADLEAIHVFSLNLRQLLLSSPLGQKRIMAVDPGFRTGCKIVCLDSEGNFLFNSTIYPHPPQNEIEKSRAQILELAKKFKTEAIAIGNGTASRETESFFKGINFPSAVEIFMVNEAGASIYSASKIAREEFPDQDVTVRGAVSIGRRLLDPLAELVKIEPKSIGVGQYQHDVDQSLLHSRLDQVVESCVNLVGVNLNTASKHLLAYVSGVGPALAESIVNFRKEHGQFKSRKQLLKVPRLGEKAFEQCAGFLRIPNSENPLDNSAVHPEAYPIVEKMAKDLKTDIATLLKDPSLQKKIEVKQYLTDEIGLPTLQDIVKELAKPGLDPRQKAKSFSFDDSIKTIDDLKEGLVIPGIVNNLTNFGAFVNIGIKESGLLHISQISNQFIKSPSDILQLNQQVKVKVVSIDKERKRVQLTMKFE
ncbi:MAG: RNA-binding transcriptional accessory protein [Leptospiraceae bacterium]|nr:RNA-binding transcriptional accessory protein [Leptospiraceae bacterium]